MNGDDDEQGEKLNGIRQIVRLKEMLKKWQYITFSPRGNGLPSDTPSGHWGISPAINRRLRNSYVMCDSDEENCNCQEPPPDVPKGYLAVYVGSELERFIIPTSYLSLPAFKELLEKAEEEYGFKHKGGLNIPCEIETFKSLLKCMENNNHKNHPEDHSEKFHHRELLSL
ncbi:auxin-responsive protein SAUR36-like [Telopea speciosissima]|uniref:auxin-responsive protein SAUR36-like n=1 Tax=Telopea speciosissima TaxID=54955 RepID=UPI001CC375F8|nr:auxin-responsive protein SAUR36-like [Telopea speciosissima]